MEWGSKWGEFDNFISFARAEENSRKLPFSGLIIDNEDTGVHTGLLFSLSMGSNRDHASATKYYSLSALVESSSMSVGRIQNPGFRLMTSEDSHRNSSMEILIGTSGASSAVKPSTPTRTKSLYQNRVPRCIVEGCSVDLSSAKGYYRKHRVCEYHSKCFKVDIAGVERRFCQQCSRFHNLSEFDDKRRSCRRRLYDHNVRRRKPQLEAYSAALSSSFYGEEQMSFQLIDGSHCHSKQFDSLVQGSNSKFTLTRGHSTKLDKGSKKSTNLEVPMEHFGARSLLSTNLYSGGVESIPVNYQCMPSSAQPMLHGMDENLPLSSYEELLLQSQQSSKSNHQKIQVLSEFDFCTNSGFYHS